MFDKEKIKDIAEGIKDGFPIFLGYFTTALAFGLLTRTSGLSFVQGLLISLTNFSGSGQFLMMNLYNAGVFILEIAISVFFLNTRYIFMASSLYAHLDNKESILGRLLVGFGTTDEIFTVAALKGKSLGYWYFAGLIFISYIGWVGGTAVGFISGTFLPKILQQAAVITVYAMFACLLGKEVRSNIKALWVLIVSAGINSICILVLGISTGVSFLLSMLVATLFGALIYTDEEAGV